MLRQGISMFAPGLVSNISACLSLQREPLAYNLFWHWNRICQRLMWSSAQCFHVFTMGKGNTWTYCKVSLSTDKAAAWGSGAEAETLGSSSTQQSWRHSPCLEITVLGPSSEDNQFQFGKSRSGHVRQQHLIMVVVPHPTMLSLSLLQLLFPNANPSITLSSR